MAQKQTMVFSEPNALGPAGTNHIIMSFEILVVSWLEHRGELKTPEKLPKSRRQKVFVIHGPPKLISYWHIFIPFTEGLHTHDLIRFLQQA